MNKLIKFALVLLLVSCVFGAGIHVGYSYCTPPHPNFRPHPAFRDKMLSNFSNKLHLTKEQKDAVALVLESQREKFDSLREELHPKFESMHTETQNLIRQILNQEQQKEFDKIRDNLMPNPLHIMKQRHHKQHGKQDIWPRS